MAIQIDLSDFSKAINEAIRIADEETIRTLSYLGEQAVITARNRPSEISWNDITGNLRSSVGYGVFKNGNSVIESAFDRVKQGTEGQSKGKQVLQQRKANSDYCLTIVAGMEYADEVEARDNKDVLATAELETRARAEVYMPKLKENVERKISALFK